MRKVVNFTDPADIRRWLAALRTEIEDVLDLSHEATRKESDRIVSRAHIRAELEKAGGTLRKLLRAGRRGLPGKTPAPH